MKMWIGPKTDKWFFVFCRMLMNFMEFRISALIRDKQQRYQGKVFLLDASNL